MRFFCARCGNDFPDDLPTCPGCGSDIPGFWRDKDSVAKLVAALMHSDTETVFRAARILRDLSEEPAAEGLIKLAKATSSVCVACAAVGALGKTGTPQTRGFLSGVAHNHPASLVRDTTRDWAQMGSETVARRDRDSTPRSSRSEKTNRR